jgi:small subunit ribosomal protein S5
MKGKEEKPKEKEPVIEEKQVEEGEKEQPAEPLPETVEEKTAPAEKETAPEKAVEEKGKKEKRFGVRHEVDWIPKTKLGNDVLAGKYKSLEDILEKGELILEPEIIDFLVPDIMQEIIYIGGSPGKGGGIRRTATKMTARMHKSGRRFKLAAVAVIGNGNGIVGIGSAISKEHRTALEKAAKNAKLNVIRVRRGCGSWECGCGGAHSIPFKISGKSGSVHITLLPAPKGVGMVASEETKKILRLAGIHDVWVKTSGKTSTRNNLVLAVFDALRNLNKGKGDL